MPRTAEGAILSAATTRYSEECLTRRDRAALGLIGMSGELLLVGSVPLDTVEQVFRTLGGPLGRILLTCPTRSATGGIGSTASPTAYSTGIRKSKPCDDPLPT